MVDEVGVVDAAGVEPVTDAAVAGFLFGFEGQMGDAGDASAGAGDRVVE